MRNKRLVVGVVGLIAAHAGLLILWDLAAQVVVTVALVLAGLLSLMLASRALQAEARSAIWLILAVSIILRGLLLPLPPTLSDDVLRYVWDGRVAIAGLNPYRLAPDAEELRPLHDGLWERLPHKAVPTVYPPLALAAFSIAASTPWPVPVLKVFLSAVDLLTCALLILLAGRHGLPIPRVCWYAWNPLVVLEVAGMGHVDALGVLCVVATMVLLSAPVKPLAAAAAAAAAVLAKAIPVAALPLWAKYSGRWQAFLPAALGLVVAASLPVVLFTGLPRGFLIYGVSWEFNGPLFEPLWRLFDGVNLAAMLESALERVKQSTGSHELLNPLLASNYPQMHAKLVLAAGLVVALVGIFRRSDLVAGTGRVFGALMIFSATVYPWYLLWVLPWAALANRIPWLALSGLLLLSYIPQFSTVELFPWIWGMVWLPFFALLSWTSLRRTV